MAVESPMNRLNEPRQIGAVNWGGTPLSAGSYSYKTLKYSFTLCLCKEIPSDVSHDKLRNVVGRIVVVNHRP